MSFRACLQQNHPHVIFAAHDRGGKHGCANKLEVEIDYSGQRRARRQRGVKFKTSPTFDTLLDDMVLPADVNRDLFEGFVEIDKDEYKESDGTEDDIYLDDDEDYGDDYSASEDADSKDSGKDMGKAMGEDSKGRRNKPGKSKAKSRSKDSRKKRRRKLMRLKRNIQGMTKFIELALVLDKSMVAKFSRRSGYTREDIVHDALQIANIADLVSVGHLYQLFVYCHPMKFF